MIIDEKKIKDIIKEELEKVSSTESGEYFYNQGKEVAVETINYFLKKRKVGFIFDISKNGRIEMVYTPGK